MLYRDKYGVSNELIPLYDTSDSPIGIIYKGVRYWYVKNLQGDILAIRNDEGTDIVRYKYDNWGKVTVLRDHSGVDLADVNPFLYRGYIYDHEYGLYYLQSRYYDPEICRFINADIPELTGFGDCNLSCNIYAYCYNNPIDKTDESGYGGIDVLINILGQAIDVLAKIIDMIGNSYNKERESLEKFVGHLSKKQAKTLYNIRELQNQTSKISKKLGWIGFAINFLTIVTVFSSSFKTGVGIDNSIIEMAIEMFVSVIEIGAGKIFEWIARFIPYIGFLIGVISGWVISYLLGKYFNDARINRIKHKFLSYVKMARVSLVDWVKYAVKSLSA